MSGWTKQTIWYASKRSRLTSPFNTRSGTYLRAADIAHAVYKNSHDLAEQQKKFGPLSLSPLPTTLDDTMQLYHVDNHLLEDVDNTREFKDFEAWVFSLESNGPQDQRMGSVVQGKYPKIKQV